MIVLHLQGREGETQRHDTCAGLTSFKGTGEAVFLKLGDKGYCTHFNFYFCKIFITQGSKMSINQITLILI